MFITRLNWFKTCRGEGINMEIMFFVLFRSVRHTCFQLALNVLNGRLEFMTPNFQLELFRMSLRSPSGGCGLYKVASEVSLAL